MRPRCTFIKADGMRCFRPVKQGQKLCGTHRKGAKRRGPAVPKPKTPK